MWIYKYRKILGFCQVFKKNKQIMLYPLDKERKFYYIYTRSFNQEEPHMNKIAKIAVIASIALAFTACGEDKKKAEAEAKRVQDSITAAAALAQEAKAAEEAEAKRVQDSIAEAKRVEDSIAEAKRIEDSLAAVKKPVAVKKPAPAPVAAPVAATGAAAEAADDAKAKLRNARKK